MWLPFDVSELGTVPAALRYETVRLRDVADLPAAADDVRLYVPAYDVGRGQGPSSPGCRGCERSRR